MVKWKNIDIGPAYYYITGTITEWLPLLNRPDIRQIVYDDIKVAVNELNASIAAFVIMPDHVYLLVFLPDEGILHVFNKKWRGRSEDI
jgi:REP element-mobilizing transposase RayT